MSDLYKLLGLPRDASQDDIQQVHRELVRKYHPDANPQDPRAEERFKEIQRAYEVLSNEKKRREYDYRLRTVSSKGSSGRPSARAGGGAAGGPTYDSGEQASRNRGPLFSLGYLLGIVLVVLVLALFIMLVLGLD